MVLDDELADIIADLRALGADDADVEVKRSEERLPRSIRETLSAFANARGGMLILGLDEAAGFRATGVRNAAKMSADLGALCSEDMEPSLRPTIKVHRFEGVDLMVAEIPALERARKPCFYRGAGQPRDDEELVPGTGRDDLDRNLVDSFVSRLRDTSVA